MPWRHFFLILSLVWLCTVTGFSSLAFTNVQTSTSIGVYRDYQEVEHYPLYHSWSLSGVYASGIQTSFHFLLDNDFTINKWHFLPTEFFVEVPIKKSALRMGRQLYTEGFDIAMLDGVQVPIPWSEMGGIKITGGSLRSADFDQLDQSSTSFGALTLWQEISKFNLRAGVCGREHNLEEKQTYAGFLRQWDSLPLSPQVLSKTEWNAADNSFSQSSSELVLQLSSSSSMRFGHSYIRPKALQKSDMQFFVYRMFAISPTESSQIDLSLSESESFQTNLSYRMFRFNSGTQVETAANQDLDLTWELSPGRWFGVALMHLNSYGGQVYDTGIRYILGWSSQSQFKFEYDVAFLDKINKVTAWAQHARSAFETRIADRAKAEFRLEAERNPYYEFDLRSMVYVTNYL